VRGRSIGAAPALCVGIAQPVMRRANFYADGFNFFHGCIRGTPYKWLDLEKFFALTFRNLTIHRIRYFTAHLRSTTEDPELLQRQLTYIRALETIPCLSVHLGRFDRYAKLRPLYANPPISPPQMVKVVEQDEKGSDVNLASYLLVDGFKGEYDVAVVVSNDSDLAEPIRLVRAELGLVVGVLNPRRRIAQDLQRVARFYRPVRQGPLSAALFPPSLADANGVITKPPGW
jgi:hypothetical protein